MAVDPGQVKDDVADAARTAHEHPVVDRLARAGLGARAVVWTVVGVLAVAVALGRSSGDTDQGGALRAVGSTPGGAVLLVVLAAGFAAWAAHRLLTAAVGHRGRRHRGLRRVKSAGEAVVYVAAAASAVRAVGGSAPDGEREARSVTAAVMGLPGGRLLVGAAGVALVALAVALFLRACRHRHTDRVAGAPARLRRPLLHLGVAGHAGRSLALGLVGGFLVDAARRFDPARAKGLDAALDTLARQPFGTGLLLLAAAGLLSYGAWSVVEMLWRDL